MHQIRNATKFVSYKDHKEFCEDMRPIYTALTTEAAELALDALESKWGHRSPMSIASWRNNWERLTSFLRCPVDVRRIVYAPDAIESLNAQMCKNTSNRKVFPNDEAVIKILFLNVRNFSNKWTRRQGWDIVMNQLPIMFSDRLSPEVIDNI